MRKLFFITLLSVFLIACTPLTARMYILYISGDELENKLGQLCTEIRSKEFIQDSNVEGEPCWHTPEDYYPWSYNGSFHYEVNQDLIISFRYNEKKRFIQVIIKELMVKEFSKDTIPIIEELEELLREHSFTKLDKQEAIKTLDDNKN